jgi:hypothetical protein
MTHENEGRSFHFLAENNDAAESWVYMIRFVIYNYMFTNCYIALQRSKLSYTVSSIATSERARSHHNLQQTFPCCS